MSEAKVESGTDPGQCHGRLECPVCLQTCVHPVQLPCSHVFCYLCVKGVVHQSRRCALCRTPVPLDFLFNPILVNATEQEDLAEPSEEKHQWYYEGVNGWWQYDERTNTEIEDRHKQEVKMFELQIAGLMYVIDLTNMRQYRRDSPGRCRRMKRDLATAPKKGIAGLKIGGVAPREGAEGQASDRQQLIPGRPNSGLSSQRSSAQAAANDQSVVGTGQPQSVQPLAQRDSDQRRGNSSSSSNPDQLGVGASQSTSSGDDSVSRLATNMGSMGIRDNDCDDDVVDDDDDEEEEDDDDDVLSSSRLYDGASGDEEGSN